MTFWLLVSGIVVVPFLVGIATRALRFYGWIICRTEAQVDGLTAIGACAAWVIYLIGESHWYVAVLTVPCFAFGQSLARQSAWRAWRQHRHHTEDCEFGPRRRHDGARVRLVQWRKVAIRPGFAAT